MLEGRERTHGNLEIHHLVRKAAHLVVEANPVLPDLLRRKDKVPLPLLGRGHDDLVIWTCHRIIDFELAAGLDLH